MADRMNRQNELYARLKERGLDPEREKRILAEFHDGRSHDLPPESGGGGFNPSPGSFYEQDDLKVLQDLSPYASYTACLKSLDELMERDRMREEDGFPRKIRIGRLVKPGKAGKEKVVIVPSTVEEKFYHDKVKPATEEESASGGSGEGREGEVIGEQPVRPQQGQGSGGAGQGGEESHDIESSAYDLGKILTEKFQLPNLKDKGKKRSLTRYNYDLTDKHRGFGQVLDKKATLRKIIESNISLGNLRDPDDIDPSGFLVAPNDRVYRILSREKDYESQAVVFFLRDYSGSMEGKVTDLVVTQHVMIYSWLLFQYAKQVETRFIVHDTEAKEVPDFYTYYNSRVAGGTQVSTAYKLVNDIVAKENLAADYNIYIFHGTDGDDWDSEGDASIPELKQMLNYANRVGITIAEHSYSRNTEVERYLKGSGLLKEKPNLLRLDVLGEDSEEPRLIEGIRKLMS
ncbi:DUF444 family protein [Geobacter sp. DSM 9736]|uniref:DUF444 family protein n=1 Tax=Geobacter sp. DSM 9736 TaxID=1277350 RepID=UPI000B61E8E9|nr:DUF444 family protein [Geobacter sp. DSM 9736]SNB47950.1 hypothetical protein SAMN06269301_3444 [Geobacter sp. DSM 9736]